jgi:hypothetical protein
MTLQARAGRLLYRPTSLPLARSLPSGKSIGSFPHLFKDKYIATAFIPEITLIIVTETGTCFIRK